MRDSTTELVREEKSKKYFLAKSSRYPEFPNNNAAQLV
jgi:hypothetical protein